ncbi:CU044_5270 family protein [Planotetraspora mira]|uniref:CU044_5270 family protein n=1 Tax=Planotetraspora mira TaxID=58121 RepID=A0A8J3XA00_9ACTN|nr:CU044_5270 family protein [Planotetraspora mira]GII29103.1 hypothetical protein Pmi06nite_25450 [Planotetraspora mira]
MDDLAMLRELRADTPWPEADRIATMQAALLIRTRHKAGRPFLRRLGRPMLLAGAVGLMTIITAALVLAGRSGGAPPQAAPSRHTAAPATPSTAPRYADPAEVLEQAALVAATRPDEAPPRPDQWQYRKYLSQQPLGDPGEVDVMEEWIRYDGKQTAFSDATGELRVRDTGPDPGDDDLSPEGYDRKLRALPTDPDALLARISGDRHWIDRPSEDSSHEDSAQRAFRVISVYLGQQAVMPPKLEAAMYRALAKIPGVEIEVGVRDGAGREGLGVFRKDPRNDLTRDYLILKPGDFRLLGSRSIYLRDMAARDSFPGIPKGAVYATAELASGIVDEAGQRP